MSLTKTPDEIEKLKRGGKILSDVLRKVAAACVVGASTEELDRMAHDAIVDAGGKPSFLGYKTSPDDSPYSGTLCISINEEVVHGLAKPDRIVQDGDIVGLDIGMWYEGLTTDMATTVMVGNVRPEVRELVKATRQALKEGISVIKADGLISDIGAAVEDFVKPLGYGIVKDLVGHGVGHAVHEDPQVPNYREPRAPTVRMQEGMVLAIEPMVTLGGWKVAMKSDGWTIVTRDGLPSAHFELTVVVTKSGFELVTPWPDA
jgi:methionyl aminopeptidase